MPDGRLPFPHFDRSDLTSPVRLVSAIVAYTDTSEMDQPHGVLSYDPETNRLVFIGPYPDAHIALLEAEKMSADFNQPKNNDGVNVIYTVIPVSSP